MLNWALCFPENKPLPGLPNGPPFFRRRQGVDAAGLIPLLFGNPGLRIGHVRCQMLDVRCWLWDVDGGMLVAGCRWLDAGCGMPMVGRWLRDVDGGTLAAGCRRRDAGCGMLAAGCQKAWPL